ncbi:MAG TPA: putative baseplate assembly protein, partial [Pyrinomonadaceae bacterium]|nr:putative baseplate assembly protein [Pyrinomonadaceae bacterium]
LTRDDVNVLPVEAQVYYKRCISSDDPRYEEFTAKYQAVLEAALSSEEGDEDSGSPSKGSPSAGSSNIELDFYETVPLPLPTASNPDPSVDLAGRETMDRALYIALLAPKNVAPEDVREVIANKTISVGVVPALAGDVPPLLPQSPFARRQAVPELVYEVPDASEPSATSATYARPRRLQQPDVLSEIGIVQLELPSADKLRTWVFSEPMLEGTGDFPPRLEDEKVRERLVTWLRLRLPESNNQTTNTNGNQTTASGNQPNVTTQSGEGGTLSASLSWVGINAARVEQAIPVVNEQLGTATGEPDQTYTLANTPVIAGSLTLEVEDLNETDPQFRWKAWLQTDDLLAADEDDPVFTLDHESGQVRFGDGERGQRPTSGSRLRASYETGGGPQGNVAIGGVKTSTDVRLQGGYKIENPIPTSGGSPGETVPEGERNIPLYLRHRDRLVTEQDFKDITARTPGVDVGRVEVLPLYRPKRAGAAAETDAPGVVTVMVIPETDPLRPLWPSPNRLFLQRVCEHLDPRRLLTTEIYARGPEYVPVAVSVGIAVRAGHFRDEVIQDVSERLELYLSSLAPGGTDETGWPLNKRLMRKDLEAVVTRVAGVEYVDSSQMGVGNDLTHDVEFYDLSGLQLPLLSSVSVREGTAEPLEDILGPAAPQAEPKVVPVPVSKSTC